MKKSWVAAACALVAGVVLYFTVFRASEEDRIRDVVTKFVKANEIKKDDNPLGRMARLNTVFKDTVDDDVRADVAEVGIAVTGRKKLAEDATKAAAMFSEATLDVADLKIKIDDSKTTAKADCTVTMKSADRTDKRDVHFLLRNDGGWKITTLDVMSPKQN